VSEAQYRATLEQIAAMGCEHAGPPCVGMARRYCRSCLAAVGLGADMGEKRGLTDPEIVHIKAERERGVTLSALALAHAVSIATIWKLTQ